MKNVQIQKMIRTLETSKHQRSVLQLPSTMVVITSCMLRNTQNGDVNAAQTTKKQEAYTMKMDGISIM